MTNRLLIAATILISCCNSTNTTNNTGVTNENKAPVSNNNFFSSIKELSVPVSYTDFTGYLTKVDKEDEFSTYLINTKMLRGKNIYLCNSFEISDLQNSKAYTFETNEEIASFIDRLVSGSPETLLIPLFKVTECNSIILGYLTYIMEDDSKFASIELQVYKKDGALLTKEPLTLFYVGGGEDGNVLIKSSITSNCTIIMNRIDRTSGNIESDKPKITKETTTFKISESGINKVK